MAEEFEIKPDKEQEKREQAKRDLAELQNLLEPEEEDDEEFDPEELEEDAVDAEEPAGTDSDAETSETQEEAEAPASSTKTEEPKSEQELEEQRQADREQAEREAMLEQQIRRKQEAKALAEMQEKRRAEQEQAAKAQAEQAAQERAAQPQPQKKPVQKKPVQKKKQSAPQKPRKTHRDAKLARKHRRQLVRMGTVLVVVLVALVLIVSAVRGIAGGSKKDNTKSNKKTTTSAVSDDQKQDTSTPASQQETKQYLKIKDDTSLPDYAKEYPGLYATAATTQKKLSDKKVCYLTFDDGPSDTCTPKILDTLKKYNVKATFFVVTSEIDGNEKLIQRIIDEGHTLCIHANEHEYQKIYASPEAYLKDFAAAYDKIYALTGYKVQGFRFPGGSNGQLKHYGNYDAIIKEMNRRGFEYYDWNAYDHDAEGGNYSASQLAQYAIHEVSISSRNDVIVLMHDTYGKENTVKALPTIIEGIQKQGIELLPITKTTRPVHFSVNENTPAEYTEETSTKSEDTSKSSSSKSATKN